MGYIVFFGALGCLLRWAIEEIVERMGISYRPYATMGVNALGALVTGFVVYASFRFPTTILVGDRIGGSSGGDVTLSLSRSQWFYQASPWLITGFCGGFTTFSSALAIPYLDWEGGRRRRGVILVTATPLLCFVGYAIGIAIGHIFF